MPSLLESIASKFRRKQTDAQTTFHAVAQQVAAGKNVDEATVIDAIENAGRTYAEFANLVEQGERRRKLLADVAAGDAAEQAARDAEARKAALQQEYDDAVRAVHDKFRPLIAAAEWAMNGASGATGRALAARRELRQTAPADRVQAVEAARRAVVRHNAVRPALEQRLAAARVALDQFDRSDIGRRKGGENDPRRAPLQEHIRACELAIVEHVAEAKKLTAEADRLDLLLTEV